MSRRPHRDLVDAAMDGLHVEHLDRHGIDRRLLQTTAVELLPLLDAHEVAANELATSLATASMAAPKA